jgi:monoamine oxidase
VVPIPRDKWWAMERREQRNFVIVGAGAAGLMAARELARGGTRVVVLEARDRCGGRIDPLPAAEFGYAAEGGAEFVHGTAALTRALIREAGLSLAPMGGTRWRAAQGVLSPDDRATPHAARLHEALSTLTGDLPIADFLATHFAEPRYAELRRSITRMVEGYDAADPGRASTFALRDEWMGRGLGRQGRIAEGYGALIAFLASECRRHGAALHLGAAVSAIEADGGEIVVRCRDGRRFDADAAILSVPLPLLGEIGLPPAAHAKAAAAQDIGYGNVVKVLLRFSTKWWAAWNGQDLADLSFLVSGAAVPTWWTQHPAPHPVLTGWFAGPRTASVAPLGADELVEMALGSLADDFAMPRDRLEGMLVASRAINWGNDPFACGAYSYATPRTRQAQAVLGKPEAGVFFSGEALYTGPEMGTVEAALASGWHTAQAILSKGA